MKPIIQYIETTGSYPGSGSRRKWSVFGQEDHPTANVNPDNFSAAPDYFKSYPDPGPNGRYLFFWQIKTLRDAPGKRKILSIQFFCHSDIYTNAKLYTNSMYFKKGKDRAPVERKKKTIQSWQCETDPFRSGSGFAYTKLGLCLIFSREKNQSNDSYLNS